MTLVMEIISSLSFPVVGGRGGGGGTARVHFHIAPLEEDRNVEV